MTKGTDSQTTNAVFVYSKRSVEYTIESVSVAGRPAVYTIISERRL